MNLIFIILNFANGEFTKIPISYVSKQISCEVALQKVAVIEQSPKGVTYKGKTVTAHYCKDLKGNWVK